VREATLAENGSARVGLGAARDGFMALRFVKTGSRRATSLAGICLALAALAVFATPAEARHWRHYRHYAVHQAAPGSNPAFAALVVDANTGRTLYAADENETRHPASLTKVMTLYLLFEQLEKGRLSLDSPITMSEHAASQAPSKLGIDPGDTISVDNGIKSIVTRSANDVAVAIGEAIAGDEDSFAEMMTRKAHALGMSRTVYVNASGLPDDRQITTAHDLAVLGRAVQEHFPRYFHYFSTHSFDYAGETIGNHNHLLGRIDGVDGIKTGYTRASGFNLLTSVHRDGRSLVAVVMGGPTAGARDRFMEALIAQHIASASPVHSATMIADASGPEMMRDAAPPDHRGSSAPAPISAAAPMQLAAAAPLPPVRSAALIPASFDAPTPPARESVAHLPREDAEGDDDNVERDPTAPTLEATRRIVRRDLPAAPAAALPIAAPVSPIPPAPPVRIADASPAALGWVKGPDRVAPAAEPKATLPAKSVATAVVAPPAPARLADKSPAALGWVKGPDGAAPAEPKGGPAAAVAHAKEETHIARVEDSRPLTHEGWVIQIGASDDAGKANDLLIRAKAQNRSTLASAKPFTEKVEKGDGAFYRARFAGLDSSSAEAACRNLKRTGFSCFATHD
jgi:D-alanyl-D-alanine carboxypeptidase